MIDAWLVRTAATPDALVGGATAVFRNAAMLSPAGRAEAVVMDLRGPAISGVNGVALAGAYRLDGRTTVAAGFQHIGIDGIEGTETSPDDGTAIVIGQDLFTIGASHALSRLRVGASAQYVRSSAVLNEESAVRLGLGAHYALPVGIPIVLAATAQSQDASTVWSAGARVEQALPFPEWRAAASYGAGGASEQTGLTHRLTGGGTWRDLITVEAGAVSEPGSDGRTVTAIGSVGVRVNRYELGVVRESLANGFGAVHTFRIGILFQGSK